MKTDEVIAQARGELVDRPARAGDANIQATAGVPSASAQAQAHLQNAAIMYAQAAACFKGLYQQQVMEQQVGHQR